MSARKAFMLGAVVGASLLAVVGAVSASSSGQTQQPAAVMSPDARNTLPPPGLKGLVQNLKHWDTLLEKLRRMAPSELRSAFKQFEAASVWRFQVYKAVPGDVYGVPISKVLSTLDRVEGHIRLADDIRTQPGRAGDVTHEIKLAEIEKDALLQLFQAALPSPSPSPPPPPPPPTVSISEDDTWAHNPEIGKSNVCINVRTTPAQASVSATLDGPDGYRAHLDKTPLDQPQGSIQIKSEITLAGDYTKTLIVYDANGNQTATVTKTFTVAPPPQDGPTTNPPCPKPTQ
jgi:hypothetical protein